MNFIYKNGFFVLPLLMIFVLSGYTVNGVPIGKPCEILVLGDEKLMVVLSEKDNCLTVFDLSVADLSKYRKIDLPGKPTGMVASSDGNTLWVTCGEESGVLVTINTGTYKIVRTLKIGHCPVSPTLDSDNDILFVCRRFTNEILCIDLKKNVIKNIIPVREEPIALAVLDNQPHILVVQHRPAVSSVADVVAPVVSIINSDNKGIIREIYLPNGSTAIRKVAVSPDGKFAYIPHSIGRYQIPTTQLERGWMNTNALTIIDIENLKWLNTVLLDDLDLGAANPWDVQVSEKNIVVSHAGTHEISIIDREILHGKLDAVVKGDTIMASYSTVEVPDDLTFLIDCRRRIKLEGNGPRSISCSDRNVFVANYFSNSIEKINLANYKVSGLIKTDMNMDDVVRGEMFFNDADLCFQNWQSCASCHPDARTDGLNWDLINDGIGNPKNTKSMLYSHFTPPVMITGIRSNAEYAVRSGIRHIQFVERPEKDAECIDSYLKSLKPVKSPYLIKGKLSSSAKRGKDVFSNAGCAQCHSGNYYTDKRSYNVGSAENDVKNQKFDTPTLCEVWRTAPYLYDGRAVNLKEMILKFNKNNEHGDVRDLSENQMNDLIEYILSL